MRNFLIRTSKGVLSDVDLIDRYLRWRDRSDWLKFKRKSCVLSRDSSGVCRFSVDSSYYGVKVVKRGNDAYPSKVSRRFSGIADSLRMFEVFRLFSKRSAEARVFFVTLTWDVGYCKAEDAWRNDSESSVSKFYNRWISGLRRRFGKVDVLRVWDSGKQGYILILTFSSYSAIIGFLFSAIEVRVERIRGVWKNLKDLMSRAIGRSLLTFLLSLPLVMLLGTWANGPVAVQLTEI